VTDPLGGLPEPAPAPQPVPQKRPFLPTTNAILAALFVAFAAEGFVGRDGAVESSMALMRLGALYLPAVQDGDFWRIGSYAFLHIGWIHILMNAWSFWVLAPQLELVFGSNLLLGFFSATALAGGAASFAYALLWTLPHGGPPVLAAGASGGVFGLFGVTVALIFRIRHQLAPQARRSIWSRVLLTMLLNAGIAFAAPVDNAAHLGGLISGMLLGLIAPFARAKPRLWHAPARWAIVGCALVLASFEGAAFARAVKPKPRTLHGAGFEAQVNGQLIPIAPGEAIIPGAAALEVRRESEPLSIESGQDAVHLGDRTWVRERSRNAEGQDVLLLEAADGSGRVVIEMICAEAPCRGPSGDRLAELTAKTIRVSR
jgi:membrane associated rhomboid family serine protease